MYGMKRNRALNGSHVFFFFLLFDAAQYVCTRSYLSAKISPVEKVPPGFPPPAPFLYTPKVDLHVTKVPNSL